MAYDNSNRLALWKNKDRKEQTHPHLTGKGETDKGYWVSAWFSKDISDIDKRLLAEILGRYESNKPFISMSLKPMEQAQEPNRGYDDPLPAGNRYESDIPF